MVTAERPDVTTADDRAWDLFFEALDADTPAAARISSGAAIVAADDLDRDTLIRRYHDDRRTVVLVHADGREDVLRPRTGDRLVGDRLLLLDGLALLAWLVLRSGHRVPA